MSFRRVVIAVLKNLAVLLLWMLVLLALLLVLLFLPLSPPDKILLLVILVVSIIYKISAKILATGWIQSAFKRAKDLSNFTIKTALNDYSQSMVSCSLPTDLPSQSHALACSSRNDDNDELDDTKAKVVFQRMLADFSTMEPVLACGNENVLSLPLVAAVLDDATTRMGDDDGDTSRRDAAAAAYIAPAQLDPVSLPHTTSVLSSFESNNSSICGGSGGGRVAALVSNNVAFEHSKVHQPEPGRVDSPEFNPPDTMAERTSPYEDRPLSGLEVATTTTCSTRQQPPMGSPEPVQHGETNLKENGYDLPIDNVALEEQRENGNDAMDCNQLTEDDTSDRVLTLDETHQDTLIPSVQRNVVVQDGVADGKAIHQPPSATSNLSLVSTNSETGILIETGGTASATTANPETLTLFRECENEGYDIYRAFVPVSNDILLGCNTFGMHTNTSDKLPSGLARLCPGYTDFLSVCFVRHQSVANKVGFTRRDVLCLVDLDGNASFAGSIRLFTEDEFELYLRRSRKGSVIPVCVARPRSPLYQHNGESIARKHQLENSHVDNELPQQVTHPLTGQLQPSPKRSRILPAMKLSGLMDYNADASKELEVHEMSSKTGSPVSMKRLRCISLPRRRARRKATASEKCGEGPAGRGVENTTNDAAMADSNRVHECAIHAREATKDGNPKSIEENERSNASCPEANDPMSKSDKIDKGDGNAVLNISIASTAAIKSNKKTSQVASVPTKSSSTTSQVVQVATAATKSKKTSQVAPASTAAAAAAGAESNNCTPQLAQFAAASSANFSNKSSQVAQVTAAAESNNIVAANSSSKSSTSEVASDDKASNVDDDVAMDKADGVDEDVAADDDDGEVDDEEASLPDVPLRDEDNAIDDVVAPNQLPSIPPQGRQAEVVVYTRLPNNLRALTADNPILDPIHTFPRGIYSLHIQTLREMFPITIPPLDAIEWIYITNAGDAASEVAALKRWWDVSRGIAHDVAQAVETNRDVLKPIAQHFQMYKDRFEAYKYHGVHPVPNRRDPNIIHYNITVGTNHGGKNRSPARFGIYENYGWGMVAQFICNQFLLNSHAKIGGKQDLFQRRAFTVQKRIHGRVRTLCKAVDTAAKVDVMIFCLDLEMDCLGPPTAVPAILTQTDDWWDGYFESIIDHVNDMYPNMTIRPKD